MPSSWPQALICTVQLGVRGESFGRGAAPIGAGWAASSSGAAWSAGMAVFRHSSDPDRVPLERLRWNDRGKALTLQRFLPCRTSFASKPRGRVAWSAAAPRRGVAPPSRPLHPGARWRWMLSGFRSTFLLAEWRGRELPPLEKGWGFQARCCEDPLSLRGRRGSGIDWLGSGMAALPV